MMDYNKQFGQNSPPRKDYHGNFDSSQSPSSEKIFNLQLTIHKLEEELLMYRNGTTSSELFELIHEKDIEIETYRMKCQERDEKLKKLAKTSGEVLLKYEKLQEEIQQIHDEKQALEDMYKSELDNKKQLEDYIQSFQEEKQFFQRELALKDKRIGTLELQVWEEQQAKEETRQRETSNEDRLREHEEIIERMKKETKDLENTVNNQRLEIERLTGEVNRWKECSADQDERIEKLQKRCAALVAEKTEKFKTLELERQEMIAHVQKFRVSVFVVKR